MRLLWMYTRASILRNGRLFHYIGDLDSPSVSRGSKGVIERLHKAGFQTLKKQPEAFGVLALK